MKLHKIVKIPGGGVNSVVALLAFAISLAATTAQAETWYLKTTDCRDALTNPAAWTNSSSQAATEFSVTDSYVVKGSPRGEIRPMAGATFAGGPLYLGEYGSPENGRHLRLSVKDSTVSFPNGLYLDYGICELRISDTGTSRLTAIHDCELQAGFITVRSPKGNNQFTFRCDKGTADSDIYDNRRLFINAPMSSPSADEGIQIGGVNGTNFTVFVNGDCSRFLGRIYVKCTTARAAGGWDTRLCIGDTTIGGEVRAAQSTAISAWNGVFKSPSAAGSPTECTVGSLTLEANSVIVVEGNTTTPTNGIIHVRDSLSVTAPVAVNIKYDPRIATTNKVTILTAPASSNLDASDFVLGFDTTSPVFHYSFTVENDGETKSLVAVFEPMVRQVSNYEKESTKEKAIDSFAEGYSSLTNAAAWSDGLVPSAEHAPAHYYSARNLRTLVAANSDYDFPGLSFTKVGGQLTLFTKSFRVPEFIAFGIPVIWTGAWTDSAIVADRFEAVSGTIDIGAYCGKTLTIDAEIVGGADFLIRGVSSTSASQGNYVLTGLNTNFTGNIALAHRERVSGRWDFHTHFQTLYVEDGRNLGGAKAAFDSKALTISDMARLAVTNADVTLESELNRGLCIQGIGRLYVDEPGSLTVNWPVRVQGTMYKEGNGTLALGGAMTVIGGQSDDATNRLFVVTNGYVKALSAGCVDGLTVSLAANNPTGLKLDYLTADPDLVQYGFKNVATDTPFEGGDINVTIENLNRENFQRTKLGLVTVKTSAADAIASRLKVAKTTGFTTTIEREDDAGTGYTTFSAKFVPRGFVLTYR